MKNLIFNNVSRVCCTILYATILSSCFSSRAANDAQPLIEPGDRTSSQSASTLALAKNGKALVPIVLAPNASNELKATAEYLASRLQKITGAKFEITNGNGASGIVVGTWAQFPVASLKKALEIRSPIPSSRIPNGKEAFAIKTEANRVLLLGGGEPGASHAASRFLEILGYRQFYPGAEWEVVPEIKSLKWNKDETNRPTILTRLIWHAFGFPNDIYTEKTAGWPNEKYTEQGRKEIGDWNRQNRMNESFHVYNAHNWTSVTRGVNAEVFKAHPEYHGWLNGERNVDTLCDSNPEVRKLAGVAAIDYLKKYGNETDMFSLEPHDGDAMCQCEKCAAVGNKSERVFALVNVAARMVAQELPGRMIGVLAYNHHDVPPSFEMEPNVHVQVARLFITGPYPFEELVRMWRAKTPNIGVYEYFSTYQHGQDRLRARFAAGPTADLSTLRKTMAHLSKQEILSLHSESSIAWGAHGRGNYIATKMMWNPDVDVEATLHDFYAKAFGPAAKAMQRYFERVDGGNRQFSTTLLALAMRDVQEASTLSRDRTDVQARLNRIKQFLYYNYLQYRVLNTPDVEARKPWMFKMLQHEYRTRNSYMTHWRGTDYHVYAIADEYKEPAWSIPQAPEFLARREAGQPPRIPTWHLENDYTPQETEMVFQEALNFFQPTTLLAKAEYSHELVPIDWGGKSATPEFQVANYKQGQVYLYSLRGENIELDLIGAKSETNASYILEDMKGNRIAGGTIVADEAKHRVSIKVPRAGLYRLKGTARGWWLYTVAPGTMHTLEFADQQEIPSYTYLNDGGLNYFYVPKGTKEFQFFWGGDKTYVYFPDGKVAAEVPAMSDYFTIKVPAGEDGKIWSFIGKHQPREFVNIPNFFSPWKDSLMLPRELAVKDGLKIRE